MNHHEHHHHHDKQSSMTFEEKLSKLLDHWMKHNLDHANTYREWAEKANTEGLDKVYMLLNEVSDITININEKFKEAIEAIKN